MQTEGSHEAACVADELNAALPKNAERYVKYHYE